MSSKEMKYGIFVQNVLLKDLSKVQKQRTALLGQIVIIASKLADRNLAVRFLKEGDTWESTHFCCSQDSVVPICEQLWPYIATITSPQERVKLAKNKSLCEKLKKISKDTVVGFIDTTDVHLGTVKYMGTVKGIGSCIGIELHYFSCAPGHGVFTTIERVIPTNYPGTSNDLQKPPPYTDLDAFLEKNMSSMMNYTNDMQPRHEEIITKYGEYPKISSMPIKNSRNSLSLQNILDVEGTTGIFNGRCIEKSRNKSEVDLIEVIGGTWSGTTERQQLENFSNLKKGLDKNDNIKEKHVHLENNTISKRNKSINPMSHFLDGSNSLKRTAKFYTNDLTENNKDESKMTTRKQETSKKINEKSEQVARSSTFYVNDKPKYHDPEPGTTNDLVIGSVVEVLNDISKDPLYGVVRWMGVENGANFILVGVELEEEQSHLPLMLTDGTHNGDRFFKCADNRAFFVPLEQCHKDSRFQEGTPTPVHQAAAVEQVDCPVIPGAVAPLCMPTEEDVEAVCGKYRGIQGHHNSCYLDVTLFSMFTYTAVFDSLLFRPKNSNDIADYDEVQRVLREEIVNPLRKNLYVSAGHVMKLRRLLDRLSSVSGLTSEEKDPEEFLNSLLAQILKAEPFLKLNSGQEAFYYQLFVEKDADLMLPTVQQLFEQSFLTSNIQLKEVPSCLIIQMPRECFDDCSNAGLESTAFCIECLKTAHRHERRIHHRPIKLEVAHDFSLMQDAYRPPRLFMELFAVICIETSHYVAFVKCGVGHEAPWCFFDSMADRKGEKDGFNIPEMVACPDISRWLSDDRICKQLHEDFPLDRHLPEHARRLLCDAYICMYQSSDVMMYR
ncbi:hypothetical protein NQ314_015782 [Rhamnusium bicolor]|uniref:ubiquitinyl hydrolase 1 n=1 Tax=Rhamnusium bicolor TaxID=1586634 RepID=A0AAV8WYM2_9CUCU|nr:hypothetical protein NQ314_015782 [Rhamnusium bicolor]